MFAKYPSISAADISKLYGTPTTNFSSLANPGASGTTGAYGGLGSLVGYSNPAAPAYTDANYQIALKTPIGRAADVFSNIFAQERQAGIQRNAARGQSILQGYEQRIGNNRALGDTFAANEDASMQGVSQEAAATRDRNMGYVDAMGNAERQRLMNDYTRNMAKTNQSAIARGLGNTTVRDSLNRGATADYNLNRLALEDRLLQNRLQTDSSLSAQYQNALAAHAAAKRARNSEYMTRESGLTGERLGFLSGIQDEYPTLADVSNLYQQARVAG